MKIAGFGSGDKQADWLEERSTEVGRYIAGAGHVLNAGACCGLGYKAVLGAYNNGGECVGYSPARNLDEHIFKYNFPDYGFSAFKFKQGRIPENYLDIDDERVAKQFRCFPLVLDSDAGIVLGGGKGTLLEFNLCLLFGKKVGVLGQSGLLTDKMIDAYINSTGDERIIIESDPITLVDKLVDLEF